MWIWYLLLGSGSGSKPVGKFVKHTETGGNVVTTAPIRAVLRVGERNGGMRSLLKRWFLLLDELKLTEVTQLIEVIPLFVSID